MIDSVQKATVLRRKPVSRGQMVVKIWELRHFAPAKVPRAGMRRQMGIG